jgi:hypothetical protein
MTYNFEQRDYIIPVALIMQIIYCNKTVRPHAHYAL